MQENQSKYNSQIEITDLIGEAVKNAVARQNGTLDSEDALSALSNKEAGGVTGGQQVPLILGGIPILPNPY